MGILRDVRSKECSTNEKVNDKRTVMKKLLLLILFTITIFLNVQAVEYDKETIHELKSDGVYFGNPAENKIIGSGSMFLIIHNPIELAVTVMSEEAKKFCKQKLGNNFTSIFMKKLGRYTAYFSCEIKNKLDKYNLSYEEKKCIEDRRFVFKRCLDLNKKNIEIINELELQIINEEKYKTHEFIHSERTKFYDQIEEHEQAAEDRRINKKIQKKLAMFKIAFEACKNLNFEEGSEDFNKCFFLLMPTIKN